MRPKLLLADDSVTIQRVIELTFADEDISVLTAGDGRDAIERVQAERPDIVLADVGMPERDGYQVAEFIKADPQLAHIPVLLLTGAFEPVDEARVKSIGCEGVLVKPFEPQMVISRVRELLRGPRRVTTAPRTAPEREAEPAVHAIFPPSAPAVGAVPSRDEAPGEDTLEAYFDRLDAALANLGPATPAPVAEPHESHQQANVAGAWDAAEEPAARRALEAVEPPTARVSMAPTPPAAAVGPVPGETEQGGLPSLHAAFAALLAAESGEPVEFLPPPPAPAPALTEEAIDDIVHRVIARLGDDRMRTLVLDTAERLVREEIDRIKRQK